MLEQVLAVEVRPPVSGRALQQRRQAPALHRLGDLAPGQVDDGGGDVDVEHHTGRPGPPPGLVQAGIGHDQRHPDRVLIQQPAVAEAPLAEEHAVVAGEDDDGVVGRAEVVQLLHHPAQHHVDAADHPVVALHVGLEQLGGAEPGPPPLPVLAAADEVGLAFDEVGPGRWRCGDDRVAVEVVDAGGPDVLLGVVVLAVGGVEADRQAEGAAALGPPPAQEVDDLVAGDVGQVAPAAVGPALEVVVRPPVLEVVEVVEHGAEGGRLGLDVHVAVALDPELADEAGGIAGPLQHRRIGQRPQAGPERRGAEVEPMAAPVHPGEKAGPAGPADRGGDEGVLEQHAPAGQGVGVGRLDDVVAGRAQRRPVLVVGEQEQDVGAAAVCAARCPYVMGVAGGAVAGAAAVHASLRLSTPRTGPS